MLSVISPYILIGVGIALIAIESFTLSFVIAWFGVGAMVIGVFSFMYDFSDGLHQLAAVSIVSLILLILLRNKVKENFMKAKEEEPNDNFLNEDGYGLIKNNLVFFKGTYFEIEELEEFEYKDGDKVYVAETFKNKAKIKQRK